MTQQTLVGCAFCAAPPRTDTGERLFQEGRQTLDEIREILDRSESNPSMGSKVVELPE